MAIRQVCPGCRSVYNLSEQSAGKKVRCKSCGAIFVVRPASARSGKEPPEEKKKPMPISKKVVPSKPKADPASETSVPRGLVHCNCGHKLAVAIKDMYQTWVTPCSPTVP